MAAGWLFLDMNSFFASVEQQENPRLRGRPVAVAPVLSDSTCVIAASYEAKRYGIKTGTNVRLAKRLCPELIVIEAHPSKYIDYHRHWVEIVQTLLPDPRVLSVDEAACRLWAGNERTDGDGVRLAFECKKRLTQNLGAQMSCSIGLAPNVFLAKVAAEMQKPNGLVLLRPDDLPGALVTLSLRDLPGIGTRMEERLHRHGIHTVSQLFAASSSDLYAVWGSVVGRRWWFMLRGSEQADYAALTVFEPQTVGHSHILPPEFRTMRGAESVLLRLTTKAATRLRGKEHLARGVQISARFRSEHTLAYHWSLKGKRRSPANDPFTWVSAVRELWQRRPALAAAYLPYQVSVTLTHLVPEHSVTLPLFEEDTRRDKLTAAMDALNLRFRDGRHNHNVIDLASVYWLQGEAPERIAFGKISDDGRERGTVRSLLTSRSGRNENV